MKKADIISVLFLLLLSGVQLSCERIPKSEDDTVVVEKRDNEAERELDELRDSVNTWVVQTDTNKTINWSGIREDFRRRTSRIDSKMDSLSAESKAEYKDLKRRYNNWEAGREQRRSMPLSPETVKRFEQELLGQYSSYQNIDANNVKEVYVTFMRNLRGKKGNWTASDWDYASHVFEKLNERREQITGNIATSDLLKIRALQTEFHTLETAGDARDLGREMKK